MTQHPRLRTLFLLSLLWLFVPTPAFAQLGTVPYTFASGATISSNQMNALFTAIYGSALNRTGGTMTGPLTTLGLLPTTDNASDIGSAALSYNDAWFDGTLTAAVLAVSSASVSKATAGSTTSFTTINGNNSNTASHASMNVTTGGASGGDPFVKFSIGGATDVAFGLDNSNSDAITLSASTGLGTNTIFTISPTTYDMAYAGTFRITGTSSSSTYRAPVFVINDAVSTASGRNVGFWQVLGSDSSGACSTPNPAANDFVGYYGCLTSKSGRSTADLGAGRGLWGANFVVTAADGYNFGLVGVEVDVQNEANEGSSPAAAFASNGKVGFGAVLASNGSTDGDGSAAFASHVAGSDTNDLWKYAFEAHGARTAAFYVRRNGNLGNIDPTNALLNDSSATTFLKTTGAHIGYILQSAVASTSSGVDIRGGNDPTVDFYDFNESADAKYWRIVAANGTFDIQTVNDAYNSATSRVSISRAGVVTIPDLASSSGTRYVCSNTSGALTDSTSACSGTDADLIALIPSLLAEVAQLRAELAAARRQ